MRGQKILVVDDDAKIVKIVQHCLIKEGFQVVAAADGEAALKAARLEDPALAIVDLMLPKINGLDVCRELLTEQKIPVIILSAKGDELDRIVGFRLGVDDLSVSLSARRSWYCAYRRCCAAVVAGHRMSRSSPVMVFAWMQVSGCFLWKIGKLS